MLTLQSDSLTFEFLPLDVSTEHERPSILWQFGGYPIVLHVAVVNEDICMTIAIERGCRIMWLSSS